MMRVIIISIRSCGTDRLILTLYLQLKFHFLMPSFSPCFPGSCILQVWNHTSALRPCKCPLCRREITLLVPSEAHHMDDGVEILQRIESYNRLYGPRPSDPMQVVECLISC